MNKEEIREYYDSLEVKPSFTKLTSTGIDNNLDGVIDFIKAIESLTEPKQSDGVFIRKDAVDYIAEMYGLYAHTCGLDKIVGLGFEDWMESEGNSRLESYNKTNSINALTTQRVTDEEITKASKELCLDSLKQSMFRKGAKWLRDKK